MEFKNYYTILHVNHSSSIDVIKKSFRKLALQYHPDTATGTSADSRQFKLIKEAYDVLSNPEKRKQYDTTFWFIHKKQEILTIEDVLAASEKIKQFASQSNPLHLNYDLLNLKLNEILCEFNINILHTCSNDKIKQSLLSNLITAASYLNHKLLLSFSKKLRPLLEGIPLLQKMLQEVLIKKRKQEFWHRYKIAFVIAVAVAACLFIALSGKL